MNILVALLSTLTFIAQIGQSRMVLPRSTCFRTIPIPKSSEGPTVTSPSSMESITSCKPGSPLCSNQEDPSDKGEQSTSRPVTVPLDTVFFVADDTNRCKFWRCTTSIWTIQMDCAPGSRLTLNYVGGSANPCSERYYHNDANNSACIRKPVITTTTKPPTLSGGIPFPSEVIPTVTRALPDANLQVALNESTTVPDPSTV